MKILHLGKLTGGSSARGRSLMALVVTCMVAAFALPNPALANGGNEEDLPFKGTVSGNIPADLGPPVPGSNGCVFSFMVSNAGTATVLGNFTGESNFVPNLCDGSYTGSFNWVATNGDRIYGWFMGQNLPTQTPGVFNNVETAVITGGTGRFKHATGMFNNYGQVNFNTGTFVLPFLGTISR